MRPAIILLSVLFFSGEAMAQSREYLLTHQRKLEERISKLELAVEKLQGPQERLELKCVSDEKPCLVVECSGTKPCAQFIRPAENTNTVIRFKDPEGQVFGNDQATEGPGGTGIGLQLKTSPDGTYLVRPWKEEKK